MIQIYSIVFLKILEMRLQSRGDLQFSSLPREERCAASRKEESGLVRALIASIRSSLGREESSRSTTPPGSHGKCMNPYKTQAKVKQSSPSQAKDVAMAKVFKKTKILQV